MAPSILLLTSGGPLRRGVTFMEMLAMEMKAEGKYVARGLSFRDAEFCEVRTRPWGWAEGGEGRT